MNKNSSLSRPFNVLLVEDNDDDVVLTRHAFEGLSVPIEFQIACDGLEALAVLRNESPYEDAPLPDIILLDLNMPRMDGWQLLAELKRDERLKLIPAIILTTSSAEDDVCNAYRNHVSAYMTKPMGIHEFASRIRCFVDFWFGDIVTLPTTCAQSHPVDRLILAPLKSGVVV